MTRKLRLATLLWSISILASRLIGLVREAALGRILGAGPEADVYLAAFLIPDFLNYLLAAGALSIVFIPLFAGHLARGDEERGWEAFSVVANFVALLLFAAVVGLWLAVPDLVGIVAPGFDRARADRLVALTRIVLPAQVFHVLGGLLSAALLARDRHALPALAPLVYTLGILAGGLIGRSAEGFAWGVLVGSAVGPFALPLVGNLRLGLRWRPRFSLRDPDLRIYLARSVPIMLGFSIIVVDDWFVTRQGSSLGHGAIAQLRYAKRLMMVPIGVFGLAAGVAAYPTLCRLFAGGRPDEARRILAGAVRSVLVLALGAQVALTAAGPEISAVVYGSRIDAGDHRTIGVALALLSIGLGAWSTQTILARGFYAEGRTWLPTAWGSIVALFSYPAYALLADRLGILGLPLASTAAILVYVVGLVVAGRRGRAPVEDGYGSFLLRAGAALAIGLAVGLGLRQVVDLPWPLLRGAMTGGGGLAAYLAALRALRVAELEALLPARLRLGASQEGGLGPR